MPAKDDDVDELPPVKENDEVKRRRSAFYNQVNW